MKWFRLWLGMLLSGCINDGREYEVGEHASSGCKTADSYIDKCEAQIGIRPLIPEFRCEDGEEVPIIGPDGVKHTVKDSGLTNIDMCKNPFLLGTSEICQTGSRVLKMDRGKEIETAVLCRHDGKSFYDVAALTRDRRSGVACFIQIDRPVFSGTNNRSARSEVEKRQQTAPPSFCHGCHSAAAITIGGALAQTRIGKQWIAERRQALKKDDVIPYVRVGDVSDAARYVGYRMRNPCSAGCHMLGAGLEFAGYVRDAAKQNWHPHLNKERWEKGVSAFDACYEALMDGKDEHIAACWETIPILP